MEASDLSKKSLALAAAVCAVAAAAFAADLAWIDLEGTNRAPLSVSSASAAMATCAVNASERASAEFDLNTNPPGFCMYLR